MSTAKDPFAAVDTATWARLSEVFDRALELPPSERNAWLDEACGGDENLRTEVEALLAADMQPATLLDRGAAAAASTLVQRVEDGERQAEDQRWLGQRVGPYRVSAILGRGGMGTVLLAERADGQFEERVALKVLRGGIASDEILRRFHQERQILASLRHPVIASLLHGGVTDDGQPYFAMEHVDGLPITDDCDRRRLGVEQRLELLLQAIEGVQHAHRNLVIHRDLKPSNILVTGDGQVQLLDFGIAKILDSGAGEDPGGEAATRAETFLLTPQYAAPEQLTGQPVTTATDVYALGVLLYELLTGELPFGNTFLGAIHGDDPEPPSRRVRSAEPPPCGLDAAALSRRLAGDLDAVVLKALRAEPEHRYPTPEALAEDLRRYLDSQPVRARRATWRYRARKFLVRHRASVVAAMLAVLALVAGLAGTAWQAAEARRARILAEQEAAAAARATVRAEQEAAVAERVAKFMSRVFVSSDPSHRGAETVTARQLLDAAAARIDEELAEAPVIQARLLGMLGVIYRRLSLYSESQPLLERSMALHREYLADDPDAMADGLFNLAMLESDLGHYDKSEPLFREALALRQSAPTRDDGDIAISLHGLAMHLMREEGDDPAEQTEMAIELLEEALAIAEEALGPEHPQTFSILNNLALAHLDLNRLDVAEPILHSLIKRWREIHGEDDPRIAASLHNLAATAYRHGLFEQAEAGFRDVLTLERQLYEEENYTTGGTLGYLGHALRRQGKLDAAEAAYREAVGVFSRTLSPEHQYVGRGLSNLGWNLIESGRPDEAEPLLRESVAILSATRGDGHERTQEARMHLGRALLAGGRIAEAEPLLRGAYPALREAKGDDHEITVLARAALEEVEAALAAFVEHRSTGRQER